MMPPPEGNPNVSNPVVSNEWKSEKVQRVCFRGDDRSPEQLYSDHFLQPTSIMGSGLQSQDPSLSPSYRVKQDGAIGDAENGVCVSRLFQTAVRFPLLSARTMTWIYAVWVARAYDTHRRQTLHAMDLIMKDQLRYASMSEQEIKDTLWSLFGEELVVHQIPAHHVIGAVKCTRENPGDVKNWNVPIRYQLAGPLWINPDCKVEEPIRKAAIDFLTEELTHHPSGQSTVVGSGFARSTGI